MICLLEYVLKDSTGKLKFVVNKFNKDSFFNFSQEYLEESELIQLVSKGEYATNFFIRNGFLNWEGETVEVPSVDHLKIPVRSFSNRLTGVYELLNFLSLKDAFFISNEEDNGITLCSNINISKTTMDIYFNYYKEKEVMTFSIIKNVEGCLEFKPFKFLLKDGLPSELKYLATKIGRKQIGGNSYNIYETKDDLYIYPLFHPQLHIPASLINYKSYQSELNSAGIAMLDTLLSKIEQGKEISDNPDGRLVKDKYSKYGVSVKVEAGKVTKSEMSTMLRLLERNSKPILEGRLTTTYFTDKLTENGATDLHLFAFRTAYVALMKESYSQAEKLHNIDLMRKNMLKEKVSLDLEIFMYRAALYICDQEYAFGTLNNGSYEYAGWAPFSTKLTKVKPR